MSNDSPKSDHLGLKTHAAATGTGSALKRYQDLIVGSRSLTKLIYFEFCSFLGLIPGAAGLLLRKLFWPGLFGSCGKGCNFAKGIILRHPGRIHLGARVVISEGCILDGRHHQAERALVLGDEVNLSNNVVLTCKHGCIKIGAHAGLGTGAIIQAVHANDVTIGEDAVLGPLVYLAAGGNYDLAGPEEATRTRPIKEQDSIIIENNVWLGGRSTVLGGVTVGAASVVAAGAVVTKSVAPGSICAGVPAKVVRSRMDEATPPPLPKDA